MTHSHTDEGIRGLDFECGRCELGSPKISLILFHSCVDEGAAFSRDILKDSLWQIPNKTVSMCLFVYTCREDDEGKRKE